MIYFNLNPPIHMKKVKLIPRLAVLWSLVAIPLHAAPPPGNFTLTFEENFNDAVLDSEKWKLGPADAFIEGVGGTNPDNFSVSGGELSIKATTTPVDFSFATYNYSCGELTSFFRYKQRYGYFEARMKWDTEQGMWPAFWLMPERDDYGTEEWYIDSFLKFDLNGSGISNVTSATLRLKARLVGNSSSDPNNAQLSAVYDDGWSEGTITWNNKPKRDPLYLEQKFGYDAPAGTFVEFDVTDFVNAEASGDGVVSLALADEFRRARGQFFHSKEASSSVDRPQLVVNGVTFYPTDDAMVKWGNDANTNFGSNNELHVRADYRNATDDTGVTTDGSQGMEVDIMESLGVWGNDEISHALHWDGYGASQKSAGWGPVPVLDTTVYNTYGVYWENGLMEFYVNGIKTGSYEDSRVIDVPAYILLSLQIGGWDGNSPTASINNKSVEIDYVRAWSGTKTSSVPTTTTRNTDGTVDLGSDFTVYGGSGNAGSNVTVEDDGAGFSIARNGWIKFPLTYTVTADTVLEFTFDSSGVGEITGIGFDEDDNSGNTKRIFQLAGSQTWTNAWQDANDYVESSGPVTYTINVGDFYTGPMSYLAITSDDDAGTGIYGQYRDVKITESGSSGGGGSPINVGALNSGVAADDSRTGTGYLMYSASNVVTRFGAQVGNADHIIAVLYSGGQWYADKNFGQVAFTPAATDVLLATVDFTNDTVSSLEGSSGTEYGIDYGYASGDLVYTADFWNGSANDGEFGVSGTTFTPNSGGGSSAVSIGALNNGIAAVDGRTGNGYLMYSSDNVITRFGAYTGNSDNVIAVYYNGSQWYADTNFGQSVFTPVASDVLLASVSFSNDTVTSLEGTNTTEFGIQKGYSSGDLNYIADSWNGSSNDGEFEITGTEFTPW